MSFFMVKINIFNGLIDVFSSKYLQVGLVVEDQNICSGSSFQSFFIFSQWEVGPFKRKGWVRMMYREKTLIQVELKYGQLPCKDVLEASDHWKS